MIQKTRSSSSSSTLSIQRKVCMIFATPHPEFEYRHGHDIYILDLNTELSNLSSLTIRVVGECFRSAAFYVLGSTLYVFQGNDGEGRPRGKRVSKYDFSGHEGGGVITLSDKKDLTWVCHMNDIKIRPVVIPTPDGKKIVVFSTQLKSLDNSTSTSNFELFDPFAAEPNCKILPDLFRSPPLSNFIGWVQLFSFLNKDVLFVQTTLTYPPNRSGMYQLNLNLVDQGSCWEPFYIPEQLRNAVEFKVIGDDICLTPEVGLRFVVEGAESSNNNPSYQFPLRPLSDGFSPPHDVFLDSGMALLDNHPHDRLFCVLRNWLTEEEVEAEEDVRISQEDEEENKSVTFRYVPHVILDVYRCNLPACKKGMLEFEEKQQREEIKSDMLADELEEKQQREKIKSDIMVAKKQKKKLKRNKKNKKIESNWKNEFVAEMDEFNEKHKETFTTHKIEEVKDNTRSIFVKEKDHARLVSLTEKNNGLLELREKFERLVENSREIKINLEKTKKNKQPVVTKNLVDDYRKKRVEFEKELVEFQEKKKKTNTNLVEQMETIKSNNMMKSNDVDVVLTELPGTELVKSFQLEFDPQPPPPFILHRIFPLLNFFSIPT